MFKISLEQHFEMEQHSCAFHGWRFVPRRKCRRCGLHGVIHMRRGAHWRSPVKGFCGGNVSMLLNSCQSPFTGTGQTIVGRHNADNQQLMIAKHEAKLQLAGAMRQL